MGAIVETIRQGASRLTILSKDDLCGNLPLDRGRTCTLQGVLQGQRAQCRRGKSRYTSLGGGHPIQPGHRRGPAQRKHPYLLAAA